MTSRNLRHVLHPKPKKAPRDEKTCCLTECNLQCPYTTTHARAMVDGAQAPRDGAYSGTCTLWDLRKSAKARGGKSANSFSGLIQEFGGNDEYLGCSAADWSGTVDVATISALMSRQH